MTQNAVPFHQHELIRITGQMRVCPTVVIHVRLNNSSMPLLVVVGAVVVIHARLSLIIIKQCATFLGNEFGLS